MASCNGEQLLTILWLAWSVETLRSRKARPPRLHLRRSFAGHRTGGLYQQPAYQRLVSTQEYSGV